MPVGFILRAIGTRLGRLRKFEPEIPLRLRVLGKYLGQNIVGGLVLPNAGVPAKFQEMQPRGKAIWQ